MKNNRLTQSELYYLQESVYRLRELASLERANFCISKEKDQETKKTIRLYMMWFEVEANKIQEILDSNK